MGSPVRDWLKALQPVEHRKQIGVDIKTAEFGWPIGMPVCRPLGDGLYEVRSHLSGNKIARVMFYVDTQGRMVLLHGFTKKTQKTPQSDLELARNNKRCHEAELKGKEVAMAHPIEDVHSGSSFDDFLMEEGLQEEVESAAVKRVLAWQFQQEMERQQKTKRAMARELNTSRSQLDRLLDPQNTTVSIETLSRAARVLGKRLVLEIRDQRPVRATRAKADFRNPGAGGGAKAKVVGREQLARGRGFDKNAIKVSKGVAGS